MDNSSIVKEGDKVERKDGVKGTVISVHNQWAEDSAKYYISWETNIRTWAKAANFKTLSINHP